MNTIDLCMYCVFILCEVPYCVSQRNLKDRKQTTSLVLNLLMFINNSVSIYNNICNISRNHRPLFELHIKTKNLSKTLPISTQLRHTIWCDGPLLVVLWA